MVALRILSKFEEVFSQTDVGGNITAESTTYLIKRKMKNYLIDFLEFKKIIEINKISKLSIIKYGYDNTEMPIFETNDKNTVGNILKEITLQEKTNKKFVIMSMPDYSLILKVDEDNCIKIDIISGMKTLRIKNHGTDIKFNQDFWLIIKKHMN